MEAEIINKAQIKEYILKDNKNLDLSLANGEKKIYVYLPPAFDKSRAEKYKVIYIFDGQNAFEMQSDVYKCSAPNSWGLDKALAERKDYCDCVVVGIFNGEGEVVRDTQLTMSQRFGRLTQMGSREYGHFENGQLESLGDFMLETLMPFVWDNFNVSKNREDVTILGASSGGLASLYLGLRDSGVYGHIGAFSPASGLFYKDDWQRFLKDIMPNYDTQKIYIYCGKNTDDFLEQMLYDAPDEQMLTASKIKGVLTCAGIDEKCVFESFLDGGIHNEIYWERALKGFLDFITK
ncbi:MAG: hypothetical protein IKC33_04670 [Clostridia bacterium]|nr:hypothetical protein [Clostridia bacterium]